MPRDGGGNFTRLRNWTADRSTGVPFSAERVDEDAADMAAALDALNDDIVALDTRVDALEAPAATTAATVVATAAVSPPGSPTNGTKYLVLPTATGAWAGQDGKIATYSSVGASYSYATPSAGNLALAVDTRIVWGYDGSAWYREGPPRQTGTATFEGASAVAITFDTAFANTTYLVAIEAPSNHTFWVTNRTTSGCTINCSGTISNSVRWSATAL